MKKEKEQTGYTETHSGSMENERLAMNAARNAARISQEGTGLRKKETHVASHIASHLVIHSLITPPPGTTYCKSLNFFVAYAAPSVDSAPMNRQTAIAFGPSVP